MEPTISPSPVHFIPGTSAHKLRYNRPMNAKLVLPLERMTVAEKMDVIDGIMDDLSRNSTSVPVIDWHGEMLKQRAESLKNGSDRFISFEEAEVQIRQKTGRG